MSDNETSLHTGDAEPDSQPAVAPYILLLEDSPGEAELFCRALVCARERLVPKPDTVGPTVEVQHTARGALDALKAHMERKPHDLPDLIVLDFDLPAGNSLMFLQELQRDFRLAKLPVIVMVWSDDESIVRALGGRGVAGYVVKPMLFEDLIVLVGDVCQHVLSQTSHQELCRLGQERSA